MQPRSMLRGGIYNPEDNPLEFHGDGEVFLNDDIAKIDAKDIPDHDLLVGGFPCQDYSVARTSATGLEGKKVYFGGKFIG